MAGGRPPFEITQEVCKRAESLAAQGLTQNQIAESLGISERTMYKKKDEFTQFTQAIKRGQAKGMATISNALFNKAKTGDNTCMIYYLKTRDPENWGEKHRLEHSGPQGQPVELDQVWKIEFMNPPEYPGDPQKSSKHTA